LADAEVGRFGEEGGYGEKDMDVDGGGLGTVDTREEILAEVVLDQVKEVGKQVSGLPEGGAGLEWRMGKREGSLVHFVICNGLRVITVGGSRRSLRRKGVGVWRRRSCWTTRGKGWGS
jgi:hypothetical protein